MVIVCFQIGALLIALGLAFLLKRRSRDIFYPLTRRFNLLARQRGWSVALSGVAGILTSMSFALFSGIPLPFVHDESSYLLGADTFAEGRIANPSHPMWMHFESFHIIVQPVYATKYPPGQSLILALGQVAFGLPIAGVWLSMGLLAASVCWMLQAFVPARWALLGSVLVATQSSTVLQWSCGYMGGALAAAGGAIVYGAWGRIRRRPQPGASILFAVGLVILANTRPFEGAIVSIPAALTIIWRLFGPNRWPAKIALMRVALPAGCVLAAAGALMAYYNSRITGNPLKLPYMMHDEQYMSAQPFVFMKAHIVPEFRHDMMRRFYDESDDLFRYRKTFVGILKNVANQYLKYWQTLHSPDHDVPVIDDTVHLAQPVDALCVGRPRLGIGGAGNHHLAKSNVRGAGLRAANSGRRSGHAAT